MKNFVWFIPTMVLAVALGFMACPAEVEVPKQTSPVVIDPDALEKGRIEGSYFTKIPTLNLVVPDTPHGVLRYSYLQAEPKNNSNTMYTLYIAEGNIKQIDDIIATATNPITVTSAEFATNNLPLDEDQPYSAVLLAENGESKAYSDVKQATTIGDFEWADSMDETGLLKSNGSQNVSSGKNAKGGITYFVDAERGNDLNDGKHPQRAFRTFKVINNEIYLGPGDQILLEANSVWNGTPVTKDNYQAYAAVRGNGGMLAPRTKTYGGTAEAPIIIDLYEVKQISGGGLKGFFSANQRPIINGNGTPSLDAARPYGQSAAMQVMEMEYVQIRNIEVTNSFDVPKIAEDPTWRDIHWIKWRYNNPYVTSSMDQRLKDGVPKSLWGFMVGDESPTRSAKGFLVENNYIHDVQSFHRNSTSNSADWLSNTYFGFPADNPGKKGGGFMPAFSDSTFKGNILRRLGYCGTHSYHNSWTENTPGGLNGNIRYIGNYWEDIYGDAIVVSTYKGSMTEWNIIESNIAVRPGAGYTANMGHYAGIWSYYATYTLYQYNEIYGMMYGYQDTQAWDIDDLSNQNIYQYNYSHHNAGGAILFILGANGVFRYNISADDGTGVRGLERVQASGSVLGRPYRPINTVAPSYTDFNPGSSIFLSYDRTNAPSTQHPLIYNNTIFVGPGHTVGLVGHKDTANRNTYLRFYNNILLKAGSGRIVMSLAEGPVSYNDGYITVPTTFANNVLWAYETDPTVPNPTGFHQGGATGMQALLGTLSGNNYAGLNGNQWKNPRLQIQETGMLDVLRRQYDTEFHDRPENNNNPERLKEFTKKERVRSRASLFMPVDQAAATALQVGRVIPATGGTGVTAIDTAWNDGFYVMDKGKDDTEVGSQFGYPTGSDQVRDFFGDPISNPPAAGAVQMPFASKSYQPDPLLDTYRYITDPNGN